MCHTEVSLPQTSLPSDFSTVKKIFALFWPKIRVLRQLLFEKFQKFQFMNMILMFLNLKLLENYLRLILLPLIIHINVALKFLVTIKIHYRRIRYRRRSDHPFFSIFLHHPFLACFILSFPARWAFFRRRESENLVLRPPSCLILILLPLD